MEQYPPQPPYSQTSPGNPYYTEPPTPGVVIWFKVYCVLMALMNLFVVGVGLLLLLGDSSWFQGNQDFQDPTQRLIVGTIYLGLGIVLVPAYILPLFLPRRKWVWIYDLVLICLSLTSCCCLPASIPLLIFWLQQKTKYYFGMWVPPPAAYTYQGYPEQQPQSPHGGYQQPYGNSPYPNMDSEPPQEPWQK